MELWKKHRAYTIRQITNNAGQLNHNATGSNEAQQNRYLRDGEPQGKQGNLVYSPYFA
jgi:hypothetical protein